MRIALIILLALMVVGCSTTETRPGYENTIMDKYIYNKEYIVRYDGDVPVKFTRDSGFTGAGCKHKIFIDNDRAFDIRESQAITVYLQPGNHFFRLELCGNQSHSEATYINVGEPQIFRIQSSLNGLLFSRIR